MIKEYTDKEYADKACEANKRGKMLYVLVTKREDTEYGSLLIAPVNYYICYYGNWTYGDLNPKYEEIRVSDLRSSKYTENDTKANVYLEQTFIVPVGEEQVLCQFIYNEKTERNLSSSALGFITGQYTEKEWTDEQGITVYLTAEDVATVFLLFNTFANAVWAKWGLYKQAIDAAQTYEELRAIKIDYSDITPQVISQEFLSDRTSE